MPPRALRRAAALLILAQRSAARAVAIMLDAALRAYARVIMPAARYVAAVR